LKLLLFLVSEAVPLLVIALAAGVVSIGVVILIREVELLSLMAVGDEVGGVTALEIAHRWSPLLLKELVHAMKPSRQQADLVIRDALILLIRSCDQRGQNKFQIR
jgi:hypothetical protein